MTDLTTELRRVLDGRWAAIKQELRDDPDPERFAPPREELTMEQYRARVAEQVQHIAATGHPARGFPKEAGGNGDLGGSVTAFEMLGHADLSTMVKAGVHWGLFGGAVANLGTERHHAAYLPSIIDGTLPGCFAMTETGHGSDVQSLGTTATYDPDTDELVVHTPSPAARKDYIGGAARDGRMAAVFAQLVTGEQTHGVHCVLVPIRDESGAPMPGVTIGDCGAKAGLPGVDNGRLTFDHVRVPRTNLLDRYGDIDEHGTYSSPITNPTRRFFTMLGTLVRGRISVAGAAGAATRTALALAVTYAGHRRQFGPPQTQEEVLLLDYRTHQRKLLPALAKSYALQLAQNQLVSFMHDVQTAGEAVDEHDQRQLEARAAGLKAVSTAHATATIQACREACGGAGYLAVNRLPALKADTDVFTTFEGDNTVLLQLVAKGLLTDYRDAFGDLDTLGMVRFGARQFAGVVLERTAARGLVQRLVAAAPGRDSENGPTDRGWQLALVEDRERHLLETLALRLRKAGKPGADLFAVFNDCQDHVVEAARAHVDRLVLESFVAAIDGCEDTAAASMLGSVCDLYALSMIEADKGWYLEHGRITPARSKQVTAAVNDLCAQLRPHAQTLVDAFGIPGTWLATELTQTA
ncbi:acyl-CoA dehydrogenase [Phycicoccus sp. M110.8]|uniref:acyl-CoA dehydrogenase family protein n=1 Tax=Phycicoccus sp. M110.8 TaxID=3075433 RepID=UPI0028FD7550|nr:acyl-CoA dehydrogenase [Phycicoccus sp. M110.8]MDU0315472.1 acyl-CoA dehydrogenase [Phycicoccus sp. M110.8]